MMNKNKPDEDLYNTLQVFAQIDGVLLKKAKQYDTGIEYAGMELLKEMYRQNILGKDMYERLVTVRRCRNEILFNGYMPTVQEISECEEVLRRLREEDEHEKL